MMKRLFKSNLAKILAIGLSIMIIAGVALSSHSLAEQADNSIVVTSPFTKAIEEVKQSVVGINNYVTRRVNNFGGFGFGFDFGFDFDNYGKYNQPNEKEVLFGAGSGVVVDDRGYILTNYHVVEGADRLTVVVDDKEYETELLGFDKLKDIAVVKAKDLNLPAVKLGDSSQIQTGDWAICIGNPISLPGTTTVGVISAKERKIATSNSIDRYGKRTQHYNVMIQTDAAINSGNSGGGMFNVSGELIGVPTIKYTNRGNFSNAAPIDGIGFAIPINEAKDIIQKSINGESVQITADNKDGVKNQKPRMGIEIRGINPNSAAVTEGIIPLGVSVSKVEENGTAAAAGLKVDDIIVEADKNIVTNNKDLLSVISEKNVGDTVTLKVYRVENLSTYQDFREIPDGEYLDISVELKVID